MVKHTDDFDNLLPFLMVITRYQIIKLGWSELFVFPFIPERILRFPPQAYLNQKFSFLLHPDETIIFK